MAGLKARPAKPEIALRAPFVYGVLPFDTLTGSVSNFRDSEKPRPTEEGPVAGATGLSSYFLAGQDSQRP